MKQGCDQEGAQGLGAGLWDAVAKRLGGVEDARDGRCADGWMIIGGPARHASDLSASLAEAAREAGTWVGVVELELGEGWARLNGAFADNLGPRQLYDRIIEQARKLPEGSRRALAVFGVDHAEAGLANMLRSHLLEEPRRFDAVVFAAREQAPRMAAIAKLCRPWERAHAEEESAFDACLVEQARGPGPFFGARAGA